MLAGKRRFSGTVTDFLLCCSILPSPNSPTPYSRIFYDACGIPWPYRSAQARRGVSFQAHVLDNKRLTGRRLWVTFIDKEGAEHKVAVSKGENLLDIAQANDLEMEGACGGSCACSTCHVIVVGEDYYDKMPEPDDDENDMLDLAFGLTETSRLGRQVVMTKELDGLRVKLPTMTRNMQAADFKSP